ncbi:MAG: hypothetical protein HY231_14580 [Acidobacteria bacterium]|nr:hypothetical protein [Acidobacteriota bacterium]
MREAFSKADFNPHTFFVGAAIEKKMADELWKELENGTIENAANLTSDEQLAALSQWLCKL